MKMVEELAESRHGAREMRGRGWGEGLLGTEASGQGERRGGEGITGGCRSRKVETTSSWKRMMMGMECNCNRQNCKPRTLPRVLIIQCADIVHFSGVNQLKIARAITRVGALVPLAHFEQGIDGITMD